FMQSSQCCDAHRLLGVILPHSPSTIFPDPTIPPEL
ncbi:MAG: hypothetical protein ACI8W8_005045, partial [Rhodothermales bacterium]